MPERDANQLAADVRAALSYCCGDDPAPGQTWEENNRAGVAALDELVGLVGTLQQERDAERRWCKHWAERAEAAEAALAEALRVTAAAAEVDTARIVALEAALAEAQQALQRNADAKGRYVVPSARVHALAQYARELQEAARDVVDWSAKSSPYEAERFADAMTRLRDVLKERDDA